MLLVSLLIIIVSYNVENLFHPEGKEQVSYTRYNQKVENIARVLTNIGEWDGVDIVGLQEVENALCVKRLCYTLRPNEYAFVHYDSPDRRGIDVALIYKKSRVDTICTRPISVPLLSDKTGEKETTRDILYVCARIDKRDTLHCFVCHLPSQRGGKAESECKRKAAKKVLQQAVDSVYAIHPKAKIIVLGDMNSEPTNDLKGVTNRMNGMKGTHKYHGQWTCLDQFYTSPAIDSISTPFIYDADWIMEPDDKYLGIKPKRTYNGYQYQNGFSDHLPIILKVEL